jgi:hypothetical protein
MNEQRIDLQYTERVLPKWTSFLPVLGVFPAIWLTLLPINEAAGVIAGVVSTVVIALAMIAKSATISISSDSLQVSTASIERKHISGVEVISKGDAFAARGRELDPRAWFHFQGSVETLVRVKISDPADPTPYWLFSTRRPEQVKKILGF